MIDNLKKNDDPVTYQAFKNIFEGLEEVPILENGRMVFNYICIQDAKIFLPGNSPLSRIGSEKWNQ